MIFQPCSLVFSNPVPILCEIIKADQKMGFSHAALATGNEDEVIGMEAEGCTRRRLHEDERKDFAVLRCNQIHDQLTEDEILSWASSKVGLKIYDYGQLIFGIPLNIDVHKDGYWVCSSFVYEAFRQAGIKLIERREPWQVELIHLWISPLLEEIAHNAN